MLERFFANISVTANDLGISDAKIEQRLPVIFQTIFFWGAALALIAILLAGVIYATSGSDETRLRQAKSTILYACVGLAIMLLAFAITSLIRGVLS